MHPTTKEMYTPLAFMWLELQALAFKWKTAEDVQASSGEGQFTANSLKGNSITAIRLKTCGPIIFQANL